MAFWGVYIRPEESHIINNTSGDRRRLRISRASLPDRDITDSKMMTTRSVVSCRIGSKPPIIICGLSLDCGGGSTMLDLEFEESKDICFSVTGPRGVHLCGFFLNTSATTFVRASDSVPCLIKQSTVDDRITDLQKDRKADYSEGKIIPEDSDDNGKVPEEETRYVKEVPLLENMKDINIEVQTNCAESAEGRNDDTRMSQLVAENTEHRSKKRRTRKKIELSDEKKSLENLVAQNVDKQVDNILVSHGKDKLKAENECSIPTLVIGLKAVPKSPLDHEKPKGDPLPIMKVEAKRPPILDNESDSDSDSELRRLLGTGWVQVMPSKKSKANVDGRNKKKKK